MLCAVPHKAAVMKIKRKTACTPLAPVRAYTYTYNQHMNARFGTEPTHIRLTMAQTAFARQFSDAGTIVGGIRRALDQAEKRCGTCQCCKKVALVEPDYSARMYPSDLL